MLKRVFRIKLEENSLRVALIKKLSFLFLSRKSNRVENLNQLTLNTLFLNRKFRKKFSIKINFCLTLKSNSITIIL